MCDCFRYYYWYPIDFSPAPLYCYLFRQCAPGDDEPEVALIVGGRHPGHYFLDSDDFNDVVRRWQLFLIFTLTAFSEKELLYDSLSSA